MTTLFPPGAGRGDPKGLTGEGRHPAGQDGTRYAPRPPSEQEKAPEQHVGVGLFRFAGCGLGLTIALVLGVGVIVLIGYLRDDPERNPAPVAYRTAVCAAFEQLSEGTRTLGRGVADDDPAVRAVAAREIERHVAAADDALTDLPIWEPGRSLDELLGSQIITLTNAAATLADEAPADDLEIALEVDATARAQLASGRYGFDCSG